MAAPVAAVAAADVVRRDAALFIGGGGPREEGGLELAENLRELGMEVTIVQRPKQLMNPFDPDMAAFIHSEVRANGVKLALGYTVVGAGGEEELVIRLLKFLACFQVFYGDRFSLRVEGGDLVAHLHGDAEAGEKALRRLEGQGLGGLAEPALITMILFKPRSWCVYCPMGTMTQLICKAKNGKDALT